MERGISVSFQCAPLLFFSISRLLGSWHLIFNWSRAMQSGIQRVKLELVTRSLLRNLYETIPNFSQHEFAIFDLRCVTILNSLRLLFDYAK